MSEAYLKEVTLPSSGKFYEGQIPGGVVSIEPLGTKEEKLFSAGYDSGAEVINKIFDACVASPVDHRDLVLGDRMYLLLQLRAISYGSNYEFPFRCSECNRRSYKDVDLTKLPVIKASGDDGMKFTVTLPILGNELVLRLLTGRDEDKIRRYIKQVTAKSKGRQTSAEYTYRLARRVVSIDGDPTGIRESMEFVESLKGQDSLAIRDAIIDADIGPDLDVEPICQHCQFENGPFSVPFNAEFFRPRRRRTKPDDYLATAEAVDAD